MQDADIIVIGSGPAGANAADAAVQSGARVTMLDGGNTPQPIDDPHADFATVRRTSEDQWQWFLGHNLSAIPMSGLTGGLGGGQISGNRSFVTADTERELPLKLRNAQVIESLALGGLGGSWGAACAYLTPSELHAMGLPPEAMESAYDDVTKIIGVSGPQTRTGIDPPLLLDHHADGVQKCFEKKKAQFEEYKIRVMQPHSAILTRDRGEREATSYDDMEYWANEGQSVYRPDQTIRTLQKSDLFTYHACIVESFTETSDGIEVLVRAKGSGEQSTVRGKRVILAAGAVGSARILLRSLGLVEKKIPFIGKHHTFSACIDLRSLGKAGSTKRSSLCQLLVTDEENVGDMIAGCAQLYSYRTLQLFRLLGSTPLPAPEALSLLAALTPSLVIADCRFPVFRSDTSTLMLQHDGTIDISIEIDRAEKERRMKSWKRLRKSFRALGIPAVKNLWLPEASTSHFAGTIPMDSDPSLPLSCDESGKVRQCQHVFVADASAFRCLPAKPHTLTIMANARRVGRNTAILPL